MKRITLILAAALALVGCAGSVNIEDGKVTGLASHDASNVLRQQSRDDAAVKAEQHRKPILTIEAHEGHSVTITGLKKLEVHAPTASGGAQSGAVPLSRSALVENAGAVGGLVRDVGSVALPWKAMEHAADLAEKQMELNAAERANTQETIRQLGEREDQLYIFEGAGLRRVPLD